MSTSLPDHFNDKGFVIIPSGIAHADVERLKDAAETLFANEPWLWSPTHLPPFGKQLTAHERASRVQTCLPEVRSIFVRPQLVEIVRRLMDDDPIVCTAGNVFRQSPARNEPDDEPSNTHIHHYAHVSPSRASVMAWIALEDVNADAGAMWICPGSHRSNEDLFDRALKDGDLRAHLDAIRTTGGPYSEWVKWFLRLRSKLTIILDADIARLGQTRQNIMAKAGDVLLFHGALTHGTHRPTRDEATRWSVVNRYRGMGSQERSWASRIGSSIYQPALEKVAPAAPKLTKVMGQDAWFVENPGAAHEALFWPASLTDGFEPAVSRS